MRILQSIDFADDEAIHRILGSNHLRPTADVMFICKSGKVLSGEDDAVRDEDQTSQLPFPLRIATRDDSVPPSRLSSPAPNLECLLARVKQLVPRSPDENAR